jgi:MarR family transcriptional regulator, organic hydroperoxide resistance regulator
MAISRQRLFFLINQAQHTLMKRLDRECTAQLGATATQITVLFHLMKNDGCLQRDVSAALHLDDSAVSGLVQRLTKLKLIRRAPCTEDRRAVRLFLSPHGRRTAENAMPLLAAANGKLTEGFSAADIEIIHRFLTTAKQRFHE